MQLQLLELVIGKENAVVPMDERVRTELIDLMARILVTDRRQLLFPVNDNYFFPIGDNYKLYELPDARLH